METFSLFIYWAGEPLDRYWRSVKYISTAISAIQSGILDYHEQCRIILSCHLHSRVSLNFISDRHEDDEVCQLLAHFNCISVTNANGFSIPKMWTNIV